MTEPKLVGKTLLRESDAGGLAMPDRRTGCAADRFAVAACVLTSLVILGVFQGTTWSIIDIWNRSETFAHGFLIVPIVVWLIWRKRWVLRRLALRPNYWMVLPLLGGGFLWLLATLVDVLVIQQFALVGMLVASLCLLLGSAASRAIAFPLAFLFFAVPVGEGLVPLLMEFTASFTVGLIRVTGISVYREGLFFSLPSGNWSVVEACSGVRYLIASATLGCLFGYLNYQRLSKRLIFIFVALLVPVVANGLRAYLIVMLGHFSDMKLATGVDHLIYGWFFFGLVILLLFAIGARWRDPDPDSPTEQDFADSQLAEVDGAKVGAAAGPGLISAASGYVSPVAVVLLSATLWPILAHAMEHRQSAVDILSINPPLRLSDWTLDQLEYWDWRPNTVGASQTVQAFYQKDGRPVGLFLAQYLVQTQGAELINSENTLVTSMDKLWRRTAQQGHVVEIAGTAFGVSQAIIRGRETDLLVWSWFRVGDSYTANPYVAKIYEAIGSLTFSRGDASWVVIATPLDPIGGEAAQVQAQRLLQQFVEKLLPGISSELDRVAGIAVDE